MESETLQSLNAASVPATAEWMARDSPFTPEEIASLFESASPLLRIERLSSPAVVTCFIEQAYSPALSRSVSTVERYLTTISRAHTLSNLPDPTRAIQVGGRSGI